MAIYESVQYRRNGKAIHGNRLDGDYRRRVFTVLPCFALSRNASLGASGPLDKVGSHIPLEPSFRLTPEGGNLTPSTGAGGRVFSLAALE